MFCCLGGCVRQIVAIRCEGLIHIFRSMNRTSLYASPIDFLATSEADFSPSYLAPIRIILVAGEGATNISVGAPSHVSD